jgi:hypothetical protein
MTSATIDADNDFTFTPRAKNVIIHNAGTATVDVFPEGGRPFYVLAGATASIYNPFLQRLYFSAQQPTEILVVDATFSLSLARI